MVILDCLLPGCCCLGARSIGFTCPLVLCVRVCFNQDRLVGLQTRADVQAIKDRLDTGLTALASAVSGNPSYAATQLDDLKPLVLPLLGSPLVGEGSAYDAAYALARSLPAALHDAAYAVASALQTVVQSRLQGRFCAAVAAAAACALTKSLLAALYDAAHVVASALQIVVQSQLQGGFSAAAAAAAAAVLPDLCCAA